VSELALSDEEINGADREDNLTLESESSKEMSLTGEQE
jgi:hypothetical protein